jgi:predicted RNase H-like HicB family nuclease
MSDYHINIFFSDEDGGYIADIPDLEACSAFGKTPEEALHEASVIRDRCRHASNA